MRVRAGDEVSVDLRLGESNTRDDHDLVDAWFRGRVPESINYLWSYAEQQGVADCLEVVMGSDFRRANHYNSDNAKDHRPIGSYIVMEKNQP